MVRTSKKEKRLNYTYQKDGEDVATNRRLHAVSKPNFKVTALDLSALSEEEAAIASALYEDWLANHKKPFEKLAAAYQKENLKSLHDYFLERGIKEPPQIKSFKCSGLVEVAP
jgi:hypothetical protein